jgi:drug/metabolite transporter (DMT)-like permease
VNRDSLALVYASITILLWATVAAVAKLSLKSITWIQLLFYVSLFSTLTLFLLLLFSKSVSELFALEISDFITHFFPVGVLGTFLYMAFYFGALDNAPAAEALIISWLSPFFIFIFSIWLLNERLSFRGLFSLCMGFIGAVIVITKGHVLKFDLVSPYGDVLAMGSAISWGLFSILSRKRTHNALVGMFLYSVSGFTAVTLFAFFTENLQAIPLKDVIGISYIGIFPTAIAFTLWIKSIEIGNIRFIANLTYLTPFLSLVFIFILTGERIFTSQIMGLVIIVGGLLLHRSATQKQKIG